MAVSEAHKKASYKYNASRDSITIRPERSKGAAIRAAAVASGKSLQNYILDALNRDRPGGIRGRRGTIGGYWGGYNSLSSSPTPRALPGKVENLTPPANGKNAPDGAPPALAVTLERRQRERCQR